MEHPVTWIILRTKTFDGLIARVGLFLFSVCVCVRERERERERGGGGEREREKEGGGRERQANRDVVSGPDNRTQ